MKRNVVLSVSIVFGLLLFQAVAMADIQVQSSTTGSSFSLNSTPSSTLGTNVLHLTYNPFTMPGSQSSNLSLNLGSFNIAAPDSGSEWCSTEWWGVVRCDKYDPYTFNLKLSFSVPAGSSVATATGDVTGTLSRGFYWLGGSTDPVGDIDIDFNNSPVLFTYSNPQGSGQFSVTVNDVLNMTVGNDGPSRTITGSISGATFTPAVPEPAAIVLFGTLMLGLGYWKKARPRT